MHYQFLTQAVKADLKNAILHQPGMLFLPLYCVSSSLDSKRGQLRPDKSSKVWLPEVGDTVMFSFPGYKGETGMHGFSVFIAIGITVICILMG